ncbi:5294_t:CDS:1, partial [Cetraspora pellucida]
TLTVSGQISLIGVKWSNLKQNADNAKKLLVEILPDLEKALEEGKFEEMKGIMKGACITSKEVRNEVRSQEAIRKLEFILPGYFS